MRVRRRGRSPRRSAGSACPAPREASTTMCAARNAAFSGEKPRLVRRRLLTSLGFSPEKAAFLAAHIVVDASRGAGHALPALRRGDLPRLRTRIEKGGMNYKGYNIAVHELGHNVE